ncbi:hypothetical protein IP70_08375 [alpha proteobacterium AAP38]|nr:hypothetical protein IP70_08375 [alpha proteobacterium AAP38]
MSFKAQALDNTSPDHYQIDNELLTDDDEARCRQVTKAISEVALEGKRSLKADGAELITDRLRFLVQVYSEQSDRSGRRAPILCCGELDREDDLWAERRVIIDAIQSFAAKIGRTVERRHIQAIENELARKEKFKKRQMSFVLLIAAFLTSVVLFVWRLWLNRQ